MQNTLFYKVEQKAKGSFMAAAVTVMPNIEEGISPREYAALKGCSLQTAYLDCWRQKVPCPQILGRWVIFLPKEEAQQ